MKLDIATESLQLLAPFRISDRVFNSVDTLVVTVSSGGKCGRGEAQGIYYLGETAQSMRDQLATIASDVIGGVPRDELQSMLPPGGARNALDCALWDLEAKQTGCRIWDLVGLQPRPLRTAYTISFERTAEEMARRALELSDWPILKIKLGADDPVGRIASIRTVRPEAELLVDANQAWTLDELVWIAPRLHRLGVRVIEQPLPRGEDATLESYESPVPLCADESCLNLSELTAAAARYQMVNIKLDKTGGLTEALQLAHDAKTRGLQLMVGNMGGSSLSMAPGFIVGLLCDVVDLDGPLDLLADREHGLSYSLGMVQPPGADLWG